MAIRIDASGEYLRRTANLPTTGAWTACCWYYYTSSAGTYSYVISLEDGTNYHLLGWTTNFGLEYWPGSSSDFATNPTVGNWYFVAIVSNGTNLVAYKLSLDGTWETISGGCNTFTPSALYFGADGVGERIDGRIAGIKVWNATLTADEIKQEAETLRPQRMENLNLWCPVFPGERTADYSGNGYTLTEGGSPTDEDGPPVAWGAPVLALPYVAASGASGTLSKTLDDMTCTSAGEVTGAAFISASLSKTLDDMTAAGAGKVTGTYFGAAGTAATGSTGLTVPYPSGISAGDTLVMMIANKYPTNAPSTPADWTAVTNGRFSGSSGTNGIDTGAAYISCFTKIATGSESGNLSVTISSGNSAVGRMFNYKKAATDIWAAQAAHGGSDNTAGTDWSVTAGADPGVTAGDWVIVGSGINTNEYTYSSQAITQTGISSWDTMVERQDSGTTTGQDSALVVSEHHALAGTSSAAPVYTMTASSSSTNNPAGASVFLRLRTIEQAIGTLTKPLDDMSCSAAGTVATPGVNGTLSKALDELTAAGTGTVEVKGSLAKSLADATLVATGSAPLVISNGSLAQTLADMTKTVTGTVEVKGSTAATLADMTRSLSGAVEVKGTTSAQLADMTKTITGAVEVKGSTSPTLADATLSSAGTVGTVTSSGSLVQTLADMSHSIAGAVEVKGSLGKSLGDVALSSAGMVEVKGSTASTLADMTRSIAGTVEVKGSASPTLADATLSSAGTVGDVVTVGSLVQTLADMTKTVTGTVEVKGSTAATLADMAGSIAGAVEVKGSLVQNLGNATLSAAGGVAVSGSLARALDGTTAAGTGTVAVKASLVQALESMILAGSGTVADYVPAVAVILVATRARALSFVTDGERGSVSTETRSLTRACDERTLVYAARRARSLVYAVEEV